MRGLLTSLADRLDGIAVAAGRIAAWAAVIMIFVIVFDVITRRFLILGSTKLQDLEWHLHAILFLMTLGYGYARHAHVRIDVLHTRLSPRAQAWAELIGTLLLLIPFCLVVLWYGSGFVERSFALNESSSTQTGLPYRWIIKAFLLGGFALLLIAALGAAARQVATLRGEEPPRQIPESTAP